MASARHRGSHCGPPRSPRPASSCPSRGYKSSRPPRRSHICRAGIWGWWHPPLLSATASFVSFNYRSSSSPAAPHPNPLPASGARERRSPRPAEAGRGRGPRQREGEGLSSHLQTIGLGCGSAEQRGFLVGGAPGGDALEGVPHDRIAAHALVDREIALEHRALRTERGDAGLDIWAPGLLEILRGGRHVVLEEGKACQLHAQPADLDIDIGAGGNLADRGAPLCERLLALAGIWPDRQRSANVIEHDRRVRKGPCQIGDIAELGMEQPRIEAEAQRSQPGKPLAEIAVAVEALGGPRAVDREARVAMPSGAVADAFEAAAGDCDMLLKDAFGAAADPEIDIADDASDAARVPVFSGRTHRRDAVDELGLAERLQFFRPVGAVHLAAFL